MEQSAWQEGASVEGLAHGRGQPFYHVLVDARDWETPWEPGITYVPQELLSAPQVASSMGLPGAVRTGSYLRSCF